MEDYRTGISCANRTCETSCAIVKSGGGISREHIMEEVAVIGFSKELFEKERAQETID